MAEISAGLLWEIFTHVRSWLANLNRAGQLDETGRRDHNTEQSLAVRWTELGFRLEDLGISKLAKRCQITGKHWSDPDHYDRDFLEKADVSLDRMERLATEILHQINR
jgi:hypothetical protein